MLDVAREAGVSHQTVSRVLNGSDQVRPQTRQRVEDAVVRLGYRRNVAARALASNRSNRLGVVAAHLNLHGPRTIAASVESAARTAGLEVSTIGLEAMSADSLAEALRRLQDEFVEAVVVAVAHSAARELTDSLALTVPVVLVEGVTPGMPMAAGVDQELGARLAVDHLLDQGHTRVAHVAGPREWIEARQRREGWLAAHRDRGLEPGREFEGDWSALSGYRAGVDVLSDEHTTAVFVANDTMAQGLLRAAHEAGRRVPDQLSVIGFDDTAEAEFCWPPLTTVRQDFADIGRRAVELALRALTGEDDPTLPLVVPELVVRATTTTATTTTGR
ncbi:LacI family DNA-binding transcriptional regulator [Aestuariimicrobium ganziense]|uniref:LacI family DNA-binding transcriptional regulator n=1 Tax=Aestuariimicrobium ganziense TaxID=2773677 RepID=UPI0019422DE5|nr:LacI family DNA-binding transcriptional regulator [Aestuariimicrobium ganziense]